MTTSLKDKYMDGRNRDVIFVKLLGLILLET